MRSINLAYTLREKRKRCSVHVVRCMMYTRRRAMRINRTVRSWPNVALFLVVGITLFESGELKSKRATLCTIDV